MWFLFGLYISNFDYTGCLPAIDVYASADRARHVNHIFKSGAGFCINVSYIMGKVSPHLHYNTTFLIECFKRVFRIMFPHMF